LETLFVQRANWSSLIHSFQVQFASSSTHDLLLLFSF
jgi:hypothetical protein